MSVGNSKQTLVQTQISVGVAANDILQLDSSAKIPAVDGSQIINLAGLTGLNIGNTIFVDNVNGNDGTGTVGRLDKPFLNLVNALGAASSGDTIIVQPGNYVVSQSILANGVNWHFMNGAIISRLHSPTFAQATLQVNGFDHSEGTLSIGDGFSTANINFINTDTDPTGTPSPGNAVVYFGNADADSDILSSILSALSTGTGVSPTGINNGNGTAPTFSFSGTSSLTSQYSGGNANFNLSGGLPGISLIDPSGGTDDYTGLFDDSVGPINSNITGEGIFISDFSNYNASYQPVGNGFTGGSGSFGSTNLSTIQINNGSILRFNCNQLTCIAGANTAIQTGNIVVTGPSDVIINCNEIICNNPSSDVGGFGVWWGNGKLTIHAVYISRGFYGIYPAANNSSLGDLYIYAETVEANTTIGSPYSGAIFSSASDPNSATWIETKVIKCSAITNANEANTILLNGTSKLYIHSQKIYGQIVNQANGLLYVTSDKWAPITSELTSLLQIGDGTTFVNINHASPSGNTLLCEAVGGTGYIQVGNYIGGISGYGVSMFSFNGSTDYPPVLNLKNCLIDTSLNTGTWAVSGSGGGAIYMEQCRISSYSGKQDVIIRNGCTGYIAGGFGSSGVSGHFRISGNVNFLSPY